MNIILERIEPTKEIFSPILVLLAPLCGLLLFLLITVGYFYPGPDTFTIYFIYIVMTKRNITPFKNWWSMKNGMVFSVIYTNEPLCPIETRKKIVSNRIFRQNIPPGVRQRIGGFIPSILAFYI